MTRSVSSVLGTIYRFLRNFFAVIGFFYTLIPVLIIILVVSQMQKKPAATPHNNKSTPQTIVVNLDGPIVEAEPKGPSLLIGRLFGQPEGTYLPDLRSTLRKAGEDKNVKELYLFVDGLSGSMADMEEIHAILTDFKKSSKQITAWVSQIDNDALIVSSAANKVIMAPAGSVFAPGPAFPMTFFGDAIRKIGVDLQVLRAGKFKSAFEPFILNEPSAEAKEMYQTLERSLRDRMLQLIATGRKKEVSEAALWLRESVFTAAKAKELGMIDELGYKPIIKQDDDAFVSVEDYASTLSTDQKGFSLGTPDGIALIEAVGEIHDQQSGRDESISPDWINEELEWAMEEPAVKGVVLRISSPGGSANASDQIWERVNALNKKKPVIVSMGAVAASGGYYIAAPAKKIVAEPSTITGSIGVIGLIPNFESFKEKYGVSFHIITQSNRAALLSGGKKLSDEDKKYMEATIDDIYNTFISKVATGRNTTPDKIHALAQGRVYSGATAKELGLVDELGGLQTAFQVAKREAGLDENKLYPIHRFEPDTLDLRECLSSLSKMRKCFRGANVQTMLEKSVLGRDYELVNKIRDLQDRAETPSVLMLYTGSVF